ncbi:hypothetical protein DPMN_140340 [Dreissena polymorpha]|uniref:Uncharacterized protein n=1 Tax=Dreissena polymorpha TaxID=45954 RepID=A0A9D4JKA6_DREPO|nr:hypothetical protein DPMN_140340 [Dreissena polymorpha]
MELDVSCNEISQLPVQIGDLKSLKSLNVRRNLLQELPVGEFGSCQSVGCNIVLNCLSVSG